jgi:Right handed beta helix region
VNFALGGLLVRKFLMAACAGTAVIGMSMFSAAAASASQAGPAAAAHAGSVIVVGPSQSIQRAVNRAHPGTTIVLRKGVYHQAVLIRKDRITLRGAGNSLHGTVLRPPRHRPRTLCSSNFGVTGVCVLAIRLDPETGAVFQRVRGVRVTGIYVAGFPGNGVFGYGTNGLTVTRVSAFHDGDYGISRFVSTHTVFTDDIAVGNDEAGFYVGDSPLADTVVRNDIAEGNEFGIFVRHARHVTVSHNLVTGNCQGILVLDDGQRGGAGNARIAHNTVIRNNRFCPKHGDTPVAVKGGGILLFGATHTLVIHNVVRGNQGHLFNSGGIVLLSAARLTKGANPSYDTILDNRAVSNRPADLIWDRTGVGNRFRGNKCGKSIPRGLCR